jgi:hypothetical protein
MTAITLATFRSRIRTLGDYPGSSGSVAPTFTDDFIDEQINDAVGQYCDLIDERWEGYRDTVTTMVTVANTATVSLPANFLKARAVDVLYDGRYISLTRLQIRQTYGNDAQTARPRGYLMRANVLELFPTPDAVYTIRLRYIPAASVLSDDADSIDIPNGWEGFIIHTALLKLDEREERPIGDRLAIIDRYRQRIISAAEDRNTAEPEYIPMPGEEQDVFW